MANIDKIALSIDEASRASGLGRTKLYELIGAGKLKARRVDRRTLILHADLLEFLNGLPTTRGEAN